MASKFWESSSSDSASVSSFLSDGDDGDNKNENARTSPNDGATRVGFPSDDEMSVSTPLPPPHEPDRIWNRIERDQVFRDVPTTTSSYSEPAPPFLRIVCMSDTHGKHRAIHIPPADALIHAGDMTKTGELGTLQDVVSYFEELKTSGVIRKEVIFIAGNHDLTLDPEHYEMNWKQFHGSKIMGSERATSIVRESVQTTYLEDSATTLAAPTNDSGSHSDDSSDIVVYGSPHTPYFFNWAFNKDRGSASTKQVWEQIPLETDVLITHGPPLGRGDQCSSDFQHVGCHDLLQELQGRERKPRLHVFGHVHEGFGSTFDGHTLYVNASSLNFNYKPLNPVIVIDLPYDKSQPARVVKPTGCPIKSGEDFALWLEANDFPNIAKHCAAGGALDRIPIGDDLVAGEAAYHEVVAALPGLARDTSANLELMTALSKLQAQSYT